MTFLNAILENKDYYCQIRENESKIFFMIKIREKWKRMILFYKLLKDQHIFRREMKGNNDSRQFYNLKSSVQYLKKLKERKRNIFKIYGIIQLICNLKIVIFQKYSY